jgi:hypothetical protein
MSGRAGLGVEAVCCLLHNLVPGGSARQWIHLLGHHVQQGGRATIVAPPGALEEMAVAAGIEVHPFAWDDRTPDGCEELWPLVSRHDVAIVHWDHRVMHTFEPALRACGRAALVLHQAPHALARWFGPEILPGARVPLDSALAERRAVVLVRGEWHRRRVASAFDLPERELRILPASIPLPSMPLRPVAAEPKEVLALMRLSPDKAAIGQLAVELVRARLAAGRDCRLTIAGDGPWRSDAVALCERRLPPGSWQVEGAPSDPIARLAASELAVAQGLTTLEAAALGRRVVVARAIDEGRAAGTVLTPERYDVAARDPFGQPPLTDDAEGIWREVLAVGRADLHALRDLVARHNSLDTSSRALADALATTTRRARFGPSFLRP